MGKYLHTKDAKFRSRIQNSSGLNSLGQNYCSSEDFMLAKIPATSNVSIFLLQLTAGSGKLCIKVAVFQFEVNVITS